MQDFCIQKHASSYSMAGKYHKSDLLQRITLIEEFQNAKVTKNNPVFSTDAI